MTESTPGAESALYRRVWRWHFYAGLVCLPFLVLLALTGGLYLFKDPIEARLYARLERVGVQAAPALDAQALVAKAVTALSSAPDSVVRYVAPAGPGRSAEVGLRRDGGIVAVYLDPADGRVLGTLRDDERLMNVVKRIHSLAIAGVAANHWIEVVAGWAIVLAVSGVFLWWPRGRREGVVTVRARPSRRLWWRDVHAVTGVFAAAALLFLAVTGLPWSAFWGEQFGRLASRWGLGTPAYLWGGTPQSQAPLADLAALPWSASHAPLPSSAAPHHEGHASPAAPEAVPARIEAASIGLNRALQRLAELGLPAGTPLRLPEGPRGVYSAAHFPDDVRAVRVVHLDRYSGAVLADIGYADYGALGKATEWGISIHTGRQFGAINQLVMLAGCGAIVALAVSAAVMWWKRRPQGRLAAPPRRDGDRAAAGAIGVAVLLGLLYPLLGASMLAALALDRLVPARWRERYGL
ncbi:PepSY-associated TM helix domain-containing protein [Piscinibacter defluvii]|uniref:PepSY-associated TM helix domain-containing protein n=1 Tax=Piscinibacter defluvii TaxID=1796922 RepID=UPI001F0CDC5D|nr:PepSY domain-containing protein [Piscinibacter defluvii]